MAQQQWENLSDPIFHHAEKHADRVAIVDGPLTVTYGALAQLVGKAAAHLDGLGIGTGHRAGISLTNGIDHVILLFALLRVGATITEIAHNPAQAPERELLERLRVGTFFLEAGAAAPASIASIRVDTRWRDIIGQRRGDHRSPASGEELTIVTLSSGSTGLPKGVVMTHRQLFDRFRAYEEIFASAALFEGRSPPPFLLTAGLAFPGFWRRLCAQTIAGAPTVLLPEYRNAIDLIKAIRAWNDAALAATANMCRAFVATAPSEGLLFPRCKALISVGMPLYAEEKRAIVERVTPNFYDSYGTSGVGTISCLMPEDVLRKSASVGRPVSGIEVEVVDGTGTRRPPDAVGRLRCRGVTSAKGYLGQQMVGEEGFIGDWYYTGDAASLDADGFLYIVGRSSELIRRGGLEFFPPEIESALATHPAVREVIVVARPNPNGAGEEVVAFVVRNGDLAQDELLRDCARRLPIERVPDKIHYIEAIPKLANGKPDRERLRTATLRQR